MKTKQIQQERTSVLSFGMGSCIPDIFHQHHQQCRCQNFQAGVKKCELVCFGVKIMIFCFFGVKKSGISVFLVSVENGAGVNKMTNITYGGALMMTNCRKMDSGRPLWVCPNANHRHRQIDNENNDISGDWMDL